MHNLQDTNIEIVIAHYIGSKPEEEGVQLSNDVIDIQDENAKDLLKHYFLDSFKQGEYFHFLQTSGDEANVVGQFADTVFQHPDCLLEESGAIAEYLYEKSVHPKIKAGELYIVYFSNCVVDGEEVDAIGLFKCETKEPFIKVIRKDQNFELQSQEGINIHKPDKGCIVFNTEKENGYLVAVVDALGKGSEAQYWKEEFLRLKIRKDEFHQTKSYLDLCKTFVVEQIPKEFQVSKADQADILNKSSNFFKSNQDFSFHDFTAEVIPQPEIKESFVEYKKQYEAVNDVKLDEEFEISMPAVKKHAKGFKNVIKLDKNFHIYVHGNREYITKGFDEETGMHYYQLFFKEEI